MTVSRATFGLMAVLSLLVGLASFRFLGLGWEKSFPAFGDHIAQRGWAFTLHVVLASLALILAVPQLITGLRARYPAVHRWTGRAYVTCVFISGGAALVLAVFAPGGAIAAVGFAALAVIWIPVTARAVFHARHGEIAAHRRWMLRSCALTFAGVTLRLYLGVGMAMDISYVAASPVLAWICWVPNLVLMEVYLRRDNLKKARASSRR